MIERLRQILIKEFIHLFRDKQARFSLLVPPLLQMRAMTAAINVVCTAGSSKPAGSVKNARP